MERQQVVNPVGTGNQTGKTPVDRKESISGVGNEDARRLDEAVAMRSK